MFEVRILELAYNALKTDPQLLSIMGENFEMFPFFGQRIPKFPYIVHKVDASWNNDPVATGTYMLDVWDWGEDRARIYAAVRRIRKILNNYMDPAGGGIRFFIRDCNYSTQAVENNKGSIQKGHMIFSVRGVDKDQCIA